MAKEMKKREEELNRLSSERIKIIEEGGTKMSNLVSGKNPFPNKKCTGKELEKCLVCKSSESENPKFSCRQNNIGYRLGCTTCKERGKTKIYEGETSRAARLRGKEHMGGLKNKNPNNVMYKHK